MQIECNQLTKKFKYPSRHLGGLRGLLAGGILRHYWQKEFAALNAISFSIEKGESVVLLGSNGSGKSTLLKIMAGVMHPTSGSLDIDGRVSALLELGAGLHPDLTGYENIFLVGKLQGQTDRYIRENLGAIAEFTGLGRFLDAQVKTYSSGMFARLAFTMATFVDPDVILIDEILSVGDADFQGKSFARIRQFREEKRTIVLVTHVAVAAEELCQRAIWLDHGEIIEDGPASEVVPHYQQAQRHRTTVQVGRLGVGGSTAEDDANFSIEFGEISYDASRAETEGVHRVECDVTASAPLENFEFFLTLSYPEHHVALLKLPLRPGGETASGGPANDDSPQKPITARLQWEIRDLPVLVEVLEIQVEGWRSGQLLNSRIASERILLPPQKLALPLVLTHTDGSWEIPE
jgi:ABC-type polysaccharide/polyol phosphate transport system ATPase subunit